MEWAWANSVGHSAHRGNNDSPDPVEVFHVARRSLGRLSQVSRDMFLLTEPAKYSTFAVCFHLCTHPFSQHTENMLGFFTSMARNHSQSGIIMPWRERPGSIDPLHYLTTLRLGIHFQPHCPGFWDTKETADSLKDLCFSVGSRLIPDRVKAWRIPESEDWHDRVTRGALVAKSLVDMMLTCCTNLTTLELDIDMHHGYTNLAYPRIGAGRPYFPSLRNLRMCLLGDDLVTERQELRANKMINVLIRGSYSTLEFLELQHSHFWTIRDLIPVTWPRLRVLSLLQSLETLRGLRDLLACAPELRDFAYQYAAFRSDCADIFFAADPLQTPADIFYLLTSWQLKADNPDLRGHPNRFKPLSDQLLSLAIDFRFKPWHREPKSEQLIHSFKRFRCLESLAFDPSTVWRFDRGIYRWDHLLLGNRLDDVIPNNLQKLGILWSDTFEELVEDQVLFDFWRRRLIAYTVCAGMNVPAPTDFQNLSEIHLFGSQEPARGRLEEIHDRVTQKIGRSTQLVRHHVTGYPHELPDEPFRWGPGRHMDDWGIRLEPHVDRYRSRMDD